MTRPLADQVVVITGASSGIGRETALLFAKHGARLLLAARSRDSLEMLASDIRREGGRAVAVPTDVSDPEAVQRLAEAAMEQFGRIDTWVSNAGVSLYSRFEDAPLDEMHRIMDVHFWGTVHSFKAALPRMKAGGGTIICVGSALSDAAVPLQSIYVAAKHAIKGLTASIRQELLQEKAPIHVTLIKPSSIDTPLFEHARTHLGVEPKGIPPVYDPIVVARAIVHCAEKPERELLVGGSGEFFSLMERVAPRMLDWQQSHMGESAQRTDRVKSLEAPSNLYQPLDGAPRSRGKDRGWKVSWVTWIREHPRATLAGAALATLTVMGARARR
jgi:short-subunit dehydrogenase